MGAGEGSCSTVEAVLQDLEHAETPILGPEPLCLLLHHVRVRVKPAPLVPVVVLRILGHVQVEDGRRDPGQLLPQPFYRLLEHHRIIPAHRVAEHYFQLVVKMTVEILCGLDHAPIVALYSPDVIMNLLGPVEGERYYHPWDSQLNYPLNHV